MHILVTGATGAVGAELVPALVRAGHDVLAATRRPSSYTGPGTAVTFDLDAEDVDPDGVVAGADAAFYLVHGLDRADVAAVDRERAERFADVWGPDRPVVYLGGLGPPSSESEHLRSRHEVGEILRQRCRTVELRASIVIGPRSLSFRLARALACATGLSPLPIVVPSAAKVRTQPIAQADLTEALVGALDLEPGSYDIGGDEVVTFAELMERTAAAQGRSVRTIAKLPVGADWFGPAASVVAGEDPWATTSLLASMATETVVDDTRRPPGPDGRGTSLDDALRAALDASEAA
jgi:uncharacterized protein YbjT (DUF2867 family)